MRRKESAQITLLTRVLKSAARSLSRTIRLIFYLAHSLSACILFICCMCIHWIIAHSPTKWCDDENGQCGGIIDYSLTHTSTNQIGRLRVWWWLFVGLHFRLCIIWWFSPPTLLISAISWFALTLMYDYIRHRCRADSSHLISFHLYTHVNELHDTAYEYGHMYKHEHINAVVWSCISLSAYVWCVKCVNCVVIGQPQECLASVNFFPLSMLFAGSRMKFHFNYNDNNNNNFDIYLPINSL